MHTPLRLRRLVGLAGLLALVVGLLAGPAAASFTRNDHTTYTDKETRQLEGTEVPGTSPTIDIDDGGALGGAPTGVAVADFNGDGHDDIAASTQNRFGAEEAWTFSDGVVVLFGEGNDGYSRPAYYPLGGEERSYFGGPVPVTLAQAGERGATDVVAADLNGDTRPDLAVANSDTDSVSVLLNTLNTGSGSVGAADGAVGPFATPVRYPTGNRPVAVAAADLDGANAVDDGASANPDDVEGAADLVVANRGDDTVTVLRNDGAGTYHLNTAARSVGSNPSAVALADLDNDGDRDVVTANSGSDDLSVLINGSGGLSAKADSPYSVGSAGTGPAGVAAADLDGDGDPDVVTANKGSDNISVLQNDGSGSLTDGTNTYAMGSDPVDVVLGDGDDDGVADFVATANSGGNDVSVRGNDNDGTTNLGGETTYRVGKRPQAVAAGNLDPPVNPANADAVQGPRNPGDIDPDLVTANNNSENVTVLHNQ